MANSPQTALAPGEVYPHPMLDGYGVEERRAMLGIRDFMERFLERRPNVTEVVYAYHVLSGMR